MKAYFLSDQHLTDINSEECQALLRFFKGIQSSKDCSHLFLVGDIFDLWVGNHRYFIEKWHAFNAELLRLVTIGVEVHFFEGNHDLHLRDYYWSQLGVYVHTSPAYFTINDKVYRIEHGDEMDPDDKNYIRLRKFWRSKPITYAIKKAPGDWIRRIGEWASDTSKKHHSVEPDQAHAERIRRIIDTHVKKAYQEKPFDIFVAGHVHLSDHREIQVTADTSVTAINLGFQQPPLEVPVT